MKNLLLLFFFNVLFLNAQQKNTVKYSDSLMIFNYPTNWKLKMNQNKEEYISLSPINQLNKSNSSVSISISRLNDNEYKTLELYLISQVELLQKKYPNANISIKTTENQYETVKIIDLEPKLSNQNYSENIQLLEYVFLNKNRIYSFKYLAVKNIYNNYLKDFNNIYQSFRLNENNFRFSWGFTPISKRKKNTQTSVKQTSEVPH